MMYYNTNREKNELLKRSIRDAKTQEEMILKFFFEHRHDSYTPFAINERVLPDCPITSVRRALTRLTELKLLKKTENFSSGIYGKQNHQWRLNVK